MTCSGLRDTTLHLTFRDIPVVITTVLLCWLARNRHSYLRWHLGCVAHCNKIIVSLLISWQLQIKRHTLRAVESCSCLCATYRNNRCCSRKRRTENTSSGSGVRLCGHTTNLITLNHTTLIHAHNFHEHCALFFSNVFDRAYRFTADSTTSFHILQAIFCFATKILKKV